MSIPGGSYSGGGAGEDHLIDASNSPGDPDPGVDPDEIDAEEFGNSAGEPSSDDETEQADAVIELEDDVDDAERD